MASNTPNLNLLKKDPLTDGNETFNIQTMLNENWDRVDQFAGQTVPISRGGTGKTTAAAALAALGGIAPGAVGNLHVWKRTQVLSEAVPAVPAGYTLGAVEENVLVVSSTKSGVACELDMGKNVSVDANGSMTLTGFSGDTGKFINVANGATNVAIYGSYFRISDVYSHATAYVDINDAVYYCPENSKITAGYDADSGLYVAKFSQLQRVTGYPYTPEIPAGTHVDYLTSEDKNAYQESSNGAAAYYTIGDVVTGSLPLYATTDGKNYVNWEVAETAAVSDDGTVSLVSPTTVNISKTDYFSKANSMLGEYIRLKDDAYSKNTTVTPGSVFFIPSDATVTNGSLDGYQMVWLTKYQPVTGHAAVPANTTIEYLGQLGDAMRSEVVSYVGTGTYGSSNPVSIKGTRKIKYIQSLGRLYSSNNYFYSAHTNSSAATSVMIADALTTSYVNTRGLGEYQYVYGRKSADGKVLSWYGTGNSSRGLNESGTTYYFLVAYE